MLPVVVMGDFNREALRDPEVHRVVKELGYQVQPPRLVWTWRGVGAHAGQHLMIGFVLVPKGLPVRQYRLVGRWPVRTDHRLVLVEIILGGRGGRSRHGRGFFLGGPRWATGQNISGNVLLGTMRHGPLCGNLIRTSPSKNGWSGLCRSYVKQ